MRAGHAPLFQIDRLVLQGVRQFVGQYGLLQLGLHPVEQVHGLGFRIVVGGHLFAEQLEEFGVQIVVLGNHAEFLQHELRTLQPLRVLVVLQPLLDVAFHLVARDELALHLVLDGKAGVLADELQNLVNRAKEFFRLRLGDGLLRFWCGAGCACGGGDGWSWTVVPMPGTGLGGSVGCETV